MAAPSVASTTESRRYSARVKQSLIAVTLVLGAITVGLAGIEIVGAVSERNRDDRIEAVNAMTNLLLDSASEWAIERGLTVTAARNAAPATADALAQIRARREKADTAFDAGLAAIAAFGTFGDKERIVAEAMRTVADWRALRRDIDAALARPAADRDPEVLRRIAPTVTATIMASQQLRAAVARVATDLEGIVANLNALKHFAWVAAEYAGRERGEIAAAIATNDQIGAAFARSLADGRGRIELAWSEVRALAAGATTPESIRTAVAEAERSYFGEFGRLRTEVYQAGLAGASYPVDAARWFAAASAGIDALLAVKYQAATETKAYATDKKADATFILIVDSIILVATLALAAFALWMTTVRVTTPLARMTAAMGTLARGDKTVAIPGLDRRDEIGAMAAAVGVFKENMIENERLQAEQRAAEERAREDEKRREEEKRLAEERAAAERRQAMLGLADRFEERIGGVIQSVSSSAAQMESAAQTLSAIAEETSRQSTGVAAAAEEATSNVQTVAASAEELSASIREISARVTESTRITATAMSDAAATNQRVKKLSESAQRIGEVVGLITEIASQTNLLALNATIEAARAGEAGKGFAVVASEVKSLANQTAKATGEISAQIADIQTATQEAVAAIESIAGTIGSINEITGSVAAAVEEQTAATREIAANVTQAAQGTQDVSSNIVGVSQASGQTGTASNDVLSAARGLTSEADALKTAVGGFLAEVRAA